MVLPSIYDVHSLSRLHSLDQLHDADVVTSMHFTGCNQVAVARHCSGSLCTGILNKRRKKLDIMDSVVGVSCLMDTCLAAC